MFVRMMLEIPPTKGRTLIPRIAMVSVDRFDYVFVKKEGKSNQFERRQILVAKENNDIVIVEIPSNDHPGLKPGEHVVTTGSLILEQMFEDRVMTEGTFLFSGTEEGHVDPLNLTNAVISTGPPASN
jgi:cobalt-zinc-cadmium efflux system membrane fusion protein